MQPILHYFLHFIFPALIAWLLYPNSWKRVYLILLATMLVDLDHLLANPVFEACRCSIGIHLLHSYPACFLYFFCLFVPRLRIPAIGLAFHMVTDALDCWQSSLNCG